MTQLIELIKRLTVQQRLLLVGAVGTTVALFTILANVATRPDYSLLYAGLDDDAAGDVITALESRNAAYRVSGNAIYVDISERDRLRLQLAREGIPGQGIPGYELLDNLSGFSTTSELFNATYWRAKEGELARTILASPGIKQARVHIAAPRENTFSRAKPTASVSVSSSYPVLPAQALSFRYLVALAVPNLDPGDVAVLDNQRGIILAAGDADPKAALQGEQTNREKQLADDIVQLLEARVGKGRARVQVSMVIDGSAQSISERIVDPESRIIAGREIEETSEQSSGNLNSAVTVASNLPDADAAEGGRSSDRSLTESRESLDYTYSETRRTIEKLPGQVEKISVAVLLDNSPDENGNELSPEDIIALRSVVAAAAGIDPARGDVLTVEAMNFANDEVIGAIAERSPINDFLSRNMMTLIHLAILLVALIVIILFVVRPILKITPAEPQLLSEPDEDEKPQTISEAPEAEIISPIDRLKLVTERKTEQTAAVIKEWLDQPEISQ